MIAHDIPHRVPARHLMISSENYWGVEGKLWKKRGGQDTSRTPKSLQSRSFALDFAGALVGERAARIRKSSNINASNGTGAPIYPEIASQ